MEEEVQKGNFEIRYSEFILICFLIIRKINLMSHMMIISYWCYFLIYERKNGFNMNIWAKAIDGSILTNKISTIYQTSTPSPLPLFTGNIATKQNKTKNHKKATIPTPTMSQKKRTCLGIAALKEKQLKECWIQESHLEEICSMSLFSTHRGTGGFCL